LGVLVSAPEITATGAVNTAPQGWGVNNEWSSNNASVAGAAVPAFQQQPTTNAWAQPIAAPAFQQRPMTSTWAQPAAAPVSQQQPMTNTWTASGPHPAAAPSPATSAQPASVQPASAEPALAQPYLQAPDSWGLTQAPKQSQSQTQSLPQPPQNQEPVQPIPPIQFGSTVQTYKPGNKSARPITPLGGFGANATHTAQSSTSDNGMAGWGQASVAGSSGVGANAGGGWGGAAPSQPEGGW
jgi:hypothetical protein